MPALPSPFGKAHHRRGGYYPPEMPPTREAGGGSRSVWRTPCAAFSVTVVLPVRYAARRCDLSCENLCGAAGAAVRSSAPSTVSLASCETNLARRCLAPPPDERSLRSAASGGRSEQGTAPRSKISRRYADEIFGNRKIIVCGSKRKGAIPTFSGGYHRLFPQKEMGVIYNPTLPPLTRSPSPDRGGFSGG